jgi:hypothetical protein
MKTKLLSFFLTTFFFLQSLSTSAIYVCYPPHGGSCSGAHCFGGRAESCGSSQYSSCDCSSTKCCCCDARFPSLNNEWLLEDNGDHVLITHQTTNEEIYINFSLESILGEDEVFTFNVVVVNGITLFVVNKYSKSTLDDLLVESIEADTEFNPSSAYIGTDNHAID